MTAARCPAAILFAGVVGYEHLMGEHQIGRGRPHTAP
jgi:hypothetical protein